MKTNRLKKLTKNLFSVSLLLLISQHAHALQLLDGVEGKTLFVKVSMRDLNSIAIEGGKVRLIKAADDSMLTGSADALTGQALIKPLVKDPFGIFVFSQSGKRYSLVLQPQDIPVESIVIREPLALPSVSKNNRVDKSSSYEVQIKTMIQTLAGNGAALGLEEHKTWKEIRLWQGSSFALERSLSSQSLIGEQYKLINNSNQAMVISEQEFYVQGVLAVAVTDISIAPGNSSVVYVVKRKEGAH
ncbi:MAG: type-F conjugative transfer system secretin TraK [Methylophilaceae bacterium]